MYKKAFDSSQRSTPLCHTHSFSFTSPSAGSSSQGRAAQYLRALHDFLCDIFFPRRCPVCDEVLPLFPSEDIPHVCAGCAKKLFPISDPVCMQCGRPLSSPREYCTACAKRRPVYHQGKSLYLYKGAIKESMYRFKYANRREYAVFFAEEALRLHAKWLTFQQFDLILPVPMYQKKKRARGYNQAEDFAVALGDLLHIPVRTDLLVRVKNTTPMKGLFEKQRAQNVKQAFQLKKIEVEYRHVLLVDDIFTTGSTMNAIAKELAPVVTGNICFLCICTGSV